MCYDKINYKIKNIVMDRKTTIINLVNQRYSYTKVGKMFGISRQRVHQIYSGYKSPATLNLIELSKIKRNNNQQQRFEKLVKQELLRKEKQIKLSAYLSNITKKVIPIGKSIASVTGLCSNSRERLRELIRVRDNHTCQICGNVWKKGERKFDVHHDDENFDGKTFELSVDECDRKNLNKMITLCHKCHYSLEITRNKMKKKRTTS
jgi:predicted transcriptional regulator